MSKKNFKYLIGIDEVGRGPLAGPVAVGVFIFLVPHAARLFRGVKESKQLTEEKREEWFGKILQLQKDGKGLMDFAVTFQSEKVIDTKGLSFAIKKCLETSLDTLIKKYKIKPADTLVLLDGGLKAPVQFKNQKTIIKGDAKEKVIALASICAKVLRDRKMKKWGKKYPQYGFEVHKGYGTRMHREVLIRYGISSLHRRSFLKSLRGLVKTLNNQHLRNTCIGV